MNGAEATLKTLADCGVEACFTNPGTSEMQMVSAFDREQRVRPVLCLFEGVATGAADGYARMAGKPPRPCCTSARGSPTAARTCTTHGAPSVPSSTSWAITPPIIRPATRPCSPTSPAWRRPHSSWVKSATTADEAAALAAEAVAASCGPPGGVATLILPADCAWSETTEAQPHPAMPLHRYAIPAPPAQIEAAVKAVKAAKKPLLLLGSLACNERALEAAMRIAGAGVRVMTTPSPRACRGAPAASRRSGCPISARWRWPISRL